MAAERKLDIPAEQMARIHSVLTRVIKDFKPTKEETERLVFCSNLIMTRLKKVVPKDVEVIFVGSGARGTQMRGREEVDIFLLFPRSVPVGTLEKKGLEYAKKIVQRHNDESYVIKYAEHPYTKLYFKKLGIKADVVPAYKITKASQLGTAVDRTQLHNNFVIGSLSERQKDEVIALKSFLRSHNIYGAEAKTEGFSGYLCELLIHHYGSFVELLWHVASIMPPVVLDPLHRKEYHGSKNCAEFVKRFSSRFIVVDPTDSGRNVAAVVSDESLARLAIISRIFLKHPSIEFLYGPKYSDVYSERKLMKLRRELGLDIYAIHFKVKDVAEDILWQQGRRLKHRLIGALKQNNFDVAFSFENIEKDNFVMALFMGSGPVRYTLHRGPSIFMREATRAFLEVHEKKTLGLLPEGDRIMSLEESKYKVPRECIIGALKGEIFPSYIKKENMKLYLNKMPEELAKMVYDAFIIKSSI